MEPPVENVITQFQEFLMQGKNQEQNELSDKFQQLITQVMNSPNHHLSTSILITLHISVKEV